MKNKQGVSNRFLAPVIILLIAGLCSVAIYFLRTEQYKDWVSTDGVVVQIERFSGGRRSSSSHRIHFSYTVNGEEYVGSSLYGGYDTDVYEGYACEVWYDPDEPQMSSFNKPTPGLDPYGPFFLAIPMAIGALGFRRKRIRM